MQNTSQWGVINRSVEAIDEDGKKAVRFDEAANEEFMILKKTDFSNGAIEFDVKGKNVVTKLCRFRLSWAGRKTCDAIYFRTFNFTSTDTARR